MKDPNSTKLAEGVPLGQFYRRELRPSPQLAMLSQPQSAIAERFRRLRTTLMSRYAESSSVLVVTSSVPGEGKTTIAVNLALALGADGTEKTLVVDADLRRPSIAAMVEPLPQLGLTEVLSGKAELRHALVIFKNTGIEFLPAGGVAESPVELLTSNAAKSLMVELRARYERIVIDTPPVVPFTDADVLAGMSDGVILVVREGMTPVDVYRQAITSVTSARVLGVVFNGTRRSVVDRSGYYDRYYSEYYARKRR